MPGSSTLLPNTVRHTIQNRGSVTDQSESLEYFKRYDNSVEVHALIFTALDRIETADDDERSCVIFSDSTSAFQAIWGQDWTHPLVL